MDVQSKIVPQELICNGDPDQVFFVIRKSDKTAVFTVYGDGRIVSAESDGGSFGVLAVTATTFSVFGATPVTQAAAPTAAVVAAASFTHTAPAADDYAIQAPTNSSAFGFVNANEFNSTMKVIQNLLKRVEDLALIVKNAGFSA